MRTWNHTLYLDAMPGRTRRDRRRGDFAEWLREMEEHRISTVVCLAPDEQIAAESPEYAEWLARQEAARLGAAQPGAPDAEIIHLPIDDFGVPVPFQAPRFWKEVERVAAKVTAGAGVHAKRRF